MKDRTIYAAVPMVLLLAVFGIYSMRLEGDRERKELDAQWATGMRYEETVKLQATLDGVVIIQANDGDAVLAGAEGGAITKALGGSNKQAAGSTAVNAIVVGAIEHMMAGCYAWLYVDGTHKRFRQDGWVCVKYKDSKNTPIIVERTIRYRDLALPGKHNPETEFDRDYVPKFQ